MKILVRAKADEDLDGIFAWISKDNRRAAVEVIRRIRQRIGRLATPGLENMGRPGLDPGTRELVVAPYVIVYEVHDARDEIEVLTIVHGAQYREGPEE
jgi:toxin ParE1/3/4